MDPDPDLGTFDQTYELTLAVENVIKAVPVGTESAELKYLFCKSAFEYILNILQLVSFDIHR